MQNFCCNENFSILGNCKHPDITNYPKNISPAFFMKINLGTESPNKISGSVAPLNYIGSIPNLSDTVKSQQSSLTLDIRGYEQSNVSPQLNLSIQPSLQKLLTFNVKPLQEKLLTLDIQSSKRIPLFLNVQSSQQNFQLLPSFKLNDGYENCDGKMCGQNKYAGYGKYVCPHNNLAVKFPNLVIEWDPSNEKSIDNYTVSSHKKVKWICAINSCGCHKWEATISNRTGVNNTGCPYCSNKKLCPHNNLEALHPELVKEWHPDNHEPMNSYAPHSNKLAWWVCFVNPCGCHIWKANINSRTGNDKRGCPFCANQKLCPHNNLEAIHPELIKEWHPNNFKRMSSYAPKSNDKVWWICNINPCGCHIYEAIINNRTRNLSGCPYCYGHKSCQHNNLENMRPDLIKEWHPNNPKSMCEYSVSSNAVVWWICTINPCGCHSWETSISNRTGVNKTGCPYCSNKKLCAHNNLEVTYPELVKEWHPDNPKQMSEYAPRSNDRVWWVCSINPCGCHIWETSIYHRTRDDATGCPYCSHRKICPHNNLEIMYPALIKEWHPENPESMSNYAPHSNKLVWWVCMKKSFEYHIWRASINDRTSEKDPRGCPHCAVSKGYSKAQIEWIKEIEIKDNIIIQHALLPEGEFKILGIGKVDGYCKETNTVYEYHGDFWHGNPDIYDPNDINRVNGKTYGSLYERTIRRDEAIRDLGYNLIVKWESY